MPAGAFTPVHETGRELTDQEIAEMELRSLPAIVKAEDGVPEITQAELALLEAQGSTVREIYGDIGGRFEIEDPHASRRGDMLFSYGKGDDQFTGRVKHVSDNSEKVWMWSPSTGEKRLQARNQILYLASIGWLPRPPKGIVPRSMDYPCPSTWAQHRDPVTTEPVMFSTPQDAWVHFKGRHKHEWEQVEAAKAAKRQDAMDALLERLAANTQVGGAELAGAMLALTEQLREVNETMVAAVPSAEAVAAAAPDPEPAGTGRKR